MRKVISTIIWSVLLGAIVVLVVKGCQSSVDAHQSSADDADPSTPTSELVEKLHKDMPVKDILEGIFSAKNDSDLIPVSHHNTAENAPTLCRMCYNPSQDSIRTLKELVNGSRKYTIAKHIVKKPRLTGKAKKRVHGQTRICTKR